MIQKRCLRCSNKFSLRRSDTVYCSTKCRVADHRGKRNISVTDNSQKVILSLCDFSGNWSLPYVAAGYSVFQIDLKNNQDCRLLKYPGTVYGILAAPPCTVFASSGARWERTETEVIEALSIVDACLRLVAVCKPRFWVLENPIGTLKNYLGEPAWYFDPCDYGDPYTKRTCLWGDFNKPKPSRVNPVEGSRMHLRYGGKSERTKALRSATPTGFSKAFFETNQ